MLKKQLWTILLMRMLLELDLKKLLTLRLKKPKMCSCDKCTGKIANKSQSPYVSHGLYMEVGKDGEMHYWAKSRIVELYP
jgi:hypothetical protein